MDTELPQRIMEAFNAVMMALPNELLAPLTNAPSSLWFLEIVTTLRMLSLLSRFQQQLDYGYRFLDLGVAQMTKHKEVYKKFEDEEAQLGAKIAGRRAEMEDLREEILRKENDLAFANRGSNSDNGHAREVLTRMSEARSEAVETLHRDLTRLNDVKRFKSEYINQVIVADERINLNGTNLIRAMKKILSVFEGKMIDAVLDLVLEWNRSKDKSTISNEVG